MNRDGALRPAPEDLGQAPDIDSFGIEPGVILLDRFCALDRVQRTAQGWSAPITDLQRRLGNAPHHRLRMEYIRAADADERKLRRAVRLVTDVQSPVHGWIHTRDGTLLLTDPVSGTPATAPLTEPEAMSVALALTATLSQLHGAGVTGVSFSPDSLHLFGRDVRVVGYEHLVTTGTAEEDVHRLAELLDFLSGEALSEMLHPTPTTALDLWERVRLRHDRAGTRKLTLPATPPFVGREEIVARLMEAARRARQGVGQVMFVSGETGMGRTRVLRRFEVEVERWVDALVIGGSFKSNAPSTLGGFVEILDALARQPTSVSTAEHEAIRDRIRAAAGPLLGMVASISPTMGQWLGTAELPSNLQLNEKFGQHAATLANAIRAVGTARRPLLLLLDGLDQADPGSRAVLQELLAGPTQHFTLLAATTDAGSDSLAASYPDRPRLVLTPFDRNELRTLLANTMPGPLADPEGNVELLWQVSHGRPQQAWTALQDWALRDAWFLDEGLSAWRLRTERCESTVNRDPYAARWQEMPPHQQWMILIAALRAGRCTMSWLAEVTGWNEAEVGPAVQAAIESGLMLAEPDGGLRFANDAIRRMIEQNVADEVRANGHRQIADWLEREPGTSHAQRAWHRELSRPVGRDERLATLHVQGGQELLAIYDMERARWHFDKALTRATTPTLWIDALEGRADVALIEGRTDEALDDYLQGMTYGADPIRGLEIAGKAIQGFYRKDAPQAAYDLASAALRLANEPLPTTRLGMFFAVFGSIAGLWRRSPASTRVRDALCRVYTYVMASLITERPVTAIIAVLRGVRHARGLDSENAAAILALYSALRGALGHGRAATRINEEAEAVARRSGKPWGLGVVYHVRSQNQLGDGQYQRASESLDLAVEHFHRAGDLSVAVFSYIFRAIYGRENQPLSKVFEWIQEAESFSRRQGDRLGLYAVSALRAFLSARKGLPGTAEEASRLSRETLALKLGNIDLVNAHAFLSLAFVHLGQPDLAWTHAQESTRRLAAGAAAADYMRDAHIAVAATVLEMRQPTQEQQHALKRSLKALHRASRRSPRLGAAWRLYSARDALRQGRIHEAVRLLVEVIDTHAIHEQSWYALEAHRLLAQIRRASSVIEADQHRQQAHALAITLGLEEPEVAEEPVRSRARKEAESEGASTVPTLLLETRKVGGAPVRIEPLIRRLLPAFESALARRVALKVDLAPEAQVECNPESLQLLVVNLVLAARDSLRDEGEVRLTVKPVRLDQSEAARLPGVRVDAHILIEARALGARRSEAISGVGICSEITASIGGFVDVRAEGPETLVLSAYLTTQQSLAEVTTEVAASPTDQVVVLHEDSRVRQTVISALRDLGYKAEGMDPDLYIDGWNGGEHIVFAEASWLQRAGKAGRAREVTLYPRGVPTPIGPSLRVPFTIRELQEAVEAITRPGSNE